MGGVEVLSHAFLTSTLDGDGQLHAPAALPIGWEAVWTAEPWNGGEEKGSCLFRDSNLGFPVLCQLIWTCLLAELPRAVGVSFVTHF